MKAALITAGAWNHLHRGILPALLFAALTACQSSEKKDDAAANARAATFVGSESCTSCHSQAAGLWKESHHAKAIEVANEHTVLGDFNEATFRYHSIESRFYRKGNEFFVYTDGPTGEMGEYKITYTFGIYPLQQYLVEFPGGRKQTLPFGWDSRTKAQGGQRWFHMYPQEKIDHNDQLHWTRNYQNWNMMCAECHSTALRKNWNPETQSYATTWIEQTVGCEACHGPASNHLLWAAGDRQRDGSHMGFTFSLASGWQTSWKFANDTATVVTRAVAQNNKVVEDVCAGCHARSSTLEDGWNFSPGRDFMDHHRPALLTDPLYWPTGEQRDEVYVWNNFHASKMYQKGVVCQDCHDPHSSQLYALDNTLCLRCHSPAKFDVPSHSFHKKGSEGSSCANCHMPYTTYMVVDERRDHSFRIPRPDISESTGSPNACIQCHDGKSNAWAMQAMDSWYGKQWRTRESWAIPFDQAAKGNSASAVDLIRWTEKKNTPDMVRATAVSLMARSVRSEMIQMAPALLADSSALVRAEAMRMLESLPVAERWRLVSPLLSDPVKTVRLEAAHILADMPLDQVKGQDAQRLNKAIAEYENALIPQTDFPTNASQLGMFYLRLGRREEAQLWLNRAIELDSLFGPAYVNLADYYRREGNEDAAQAILTQGIRCVPDNGGLFYARALGRVRMGDVENALTDLRTAMKLEPENNQFAYVYAIALHDKVSVRAGVAVLKSAIQRQPKNGDLLRVMVGWQLELQDFQEAKRYMNDYRTLHPNDPILAQWRQSIP